MSFIEYKNRQLNPFMDTDMQNAMNWGLAPGFTPTFRGGHTYYDTPAVSNKPSQALNAFKPKQQRQAAGKGRTSMPPARKPSAKPKSIPTLPNRDKAPIQPPQIALQPIGPAQFDTRTELPQGQPPLNELPDMAQFFAPPMVPMYDNGQGQGVAQLPDFGGGLPFEPAAMPQPDIQNAPGDFGLPWTYADMPMPQMSDTPAAQQPLSGGVADHSPGAWYDLTHGNYNNTVASAPTDTQRPLLQLGVGQNVSPWGIMETSTHVKATGQNNPNYLKGKDARLNMSTGRSLGFIGPNGGVLGASRQPVNTPDYASLPAINAPMLYADTPVTAYGVDGEVSKDVMGNDALMDARHEFDDADSVISQRMEAAQKQYERQRKALALSAMFGNRNAPSQMAQLNSGFNNFMLGGFNAMHQNRADYRGMAEMYDTRTARNRRYEHQNKTDDANVDINRQNATTRGRQADVAEGQLKRQTAADVYRQKHDSELLQQQQAENMARQSTAAQDAMVRAMLGQQASKDRAADRQSREGIASANRGAANSRAKSHDDTMRDLFGRKQDAEVKKEGRQDKGKARDEMRKQVLDMQDALHKNDKRLDVSSMLDTLAPRLKSGRAKAITADLASTPGWKAMTEDGRMRMLANAFAQAALDDTDDNDGDD